MIKFYTLMATLSVKIYGWSVLKILEKFDEKRKPIRK